jgi:hypothetical protein
MDYWVFVLGYDLLHDLLNHLECDIAFEFCQEVYNDFEKSEYNMLHLSGYTCLEKYVRDNYTTIKGKLENI